MNMKEMTPKEKKDGQSGCATLILFVIIILCFRSCSCMPERTPEQKKEDEEKKELFEALDMADRFAKERCQYPESVKFTYGTDANNVVTPLGGGRFIVHHHITASNGFGVPIKVNYTCELHRKPGSNKTWICDSCVLSEP